MYDASRELLSINDANLAANLENVTINEEILRRGKATDAQIVLLLESILEEVKRR